MYKQNKVLAPKNLNLHFKKIGNKLMEHKSTDSMEQRRDCIVI